MTEVRVTSTPPYPTSIVVGHVHVYSFTAENIHFLFEKHLITAVPICENHITLWNVVDCGPWQEIAISRIFNNIISLQLKDIVYMNINMFKKSITLI